MFTACVNSRTALYSRNFPSLAAWCSPVEQNIVSLCVYACVHSHMRLVFFFLFYLKEETGRFFVFGPGRYCVQSEGVRCCYKCNDDVTIRYGKRRTLCCGRLVSGGKATSVDVFECSLSRETLTKNEDFPNP